MKDETLFAQARAGCQASREELFRRHQVSALKAARPYFPKEAHRPDANADILQAAHMGLVIAIDRHEPAAPGEERRDNFPAFAFSNARRHAREAALRHRHIAGKVNQRVQFGSVSHLSLDVPVGEGAEETWLDRLPDPHPQDPDELAHRSILAERIQAALGQLTDHEAFVIRARFFEELVLDQVGAALGVTRERARQIEAKALTRLRTVLEGMGIGEAEGAV